MDDVRQIRPNLEKVKCSKCGRRDDLHLITLKYEREINCGRTLLYCRSCKEYAKSNIGIELPINDITIHRFLSLYRDGYTCSDPYTAVDIVFGEAVPFISEEAQKILYSTKVE